jgi:predicted O-methyltransferase YrrM
MNHNPDSTWLAGQYARAVATPSDINEHLPTMLELVSQLDATKVVELGTRGGVSTLAWLHALDGRGHLWSVDIDPRPDLPEFDHWTFIQGDDCSADVYGALPDQVDIVFIDTSHAYDHTVRELDLYRWIVRPGGVIVLHDTELYQPGEVGPQPPFPVKKAVLEFVTAEGLTWTNYENNNGLGVIQL